MIRYHDGEGGEVRPSGLASALGEWPLVISLELGESWLYDIFHVERGGRQLVTSSRRRPKCRRSDFSDAYEVSNINFPSEH